ncbi:hypothetical protein ACFQ3Z_01335 [Streptomyces nogalater]
MSDDTDITTAARDRGADAAVDDVTALLGRRFSWPRVRCPAGRVHRRGRGHARLQRQRAGAERAGRLGTGPRGRRVGAAADEPGPQPPVLR